MTDFFNKTVITRLSWFVISTYCLFMLGFFFIPNAVDQYKFYSVAVFIPALLLLPAMARTIAYDRLNLFIVIYLLWMLLSSFWSASFDLGAFLKTVRLVAYIVVFIALNVYIIRHKLTFYDGFFKALYVSAAVAALISIILWEMAPPPHPGARLVGMGTLDNPNPSSFVYGFFALISCRSALTQASKPQKTLYALCAVLLTALVILTESNTGILAVMLSMALVLILSQGTRLIHLFGGVIAMIGALLFLAYSVGMLETHIDAGFSQRLYIWQIVIEQISQAPWIGHGYQKTLLLDEQGLADAASYAHNALLASLRDGGLVALTLHTLILLTAVGTAWRLYRRDKEPVYLAYLLFGFICMSADTDQLITRPRELWIIFWWPLAMLIAQRTLAEADRKRSGNQPVE